MASQLELRVQGYSLTRNGAGVGGGKRGVPKMVVVGKVLRNQRRLCGAGGQAGSQQGPE